ncbi:MAG TPA: RNA polymerase recycling motor HelD [Clostridia bacterium]|nr:RNA polymerase recycling motor HelD [Clostridia bacterium]
MTAEKHPQYKEEKLRLETTLGYVEKSIAQMVEKKGKLENDIDRNKKHATDDNSQQYIELMINSMLQERAALRLRNLLTARSRPYFARIDFREDEKIKTESLYIGKMALIREEDQELIIVDWRAPVANLYYEGRLGDASYQSPEGNINGSLLLKRQFSIEEGKLKEIFDIDITTNDEFLQASLGANADSRLKEIVSTIQEEQNRVIRADMWKPLIVQGAAGSGKTTIALHRIAYLIYTYEKTFKPDNFMIIAPTEFFLNYISEVLPELGVEKTKQTTFEEFAANIIGQKFKVRDANEKLLNFLISNPDPEQKEKNRLLRQESEFKSSMVFRDVLDEYIAEVEQEFIPKEDFRLLTKVIYSYEEINKLFKTDYRKQPFTKRIEEIKKHLTNRLKAQKQAIIQEAQTVCDKKMVQAKMIFEEGEERQRIITELIDKKNDFIVRIEQYCKSAVKDYVRKISRINPYEYYMDFMSRKELFHKLTEGRVSREASGLIRENTIRSLNSGYMDIEDLAPIIYLKFKIHGVDEKLPVKHIVIDEAQDFSVFQLYVLKSIIKDSSFTILGDLSQGIHSYRGIKDWGDVDRYVFETRCERLVLEQSYRTTVEIMEAANKVIGYLKNESLIPAKPVIRHGNKVEKIEKQNRREIAADIWNKIKELKKQKFKSIAIICRTAETCGELREGFKAGKEAPRIITEKDREYKSGVVIVPAHLSKGLEFDVVFIADAEAESYRDNELDVKLLYVAMTRPLHRLYIYHCGTQSKLIEML